MSQQFFQNGNEKKDYGEARTIRTRPKLVKYDPYSRKTKKVEPSENCDKWNFFQTEECYEIDETAENNIIGRVAIHPSHQVNFVYLGRPGTKRPTVVCFSMYQAGKVIAFLGKVLEEFAAMEEKRVKQGLSETPVIPLLKGKEDRTYPENGSGRVLFWNNADVDLGTVRVACYLNSNIGKPEVLMNSPVLAKYSDENDGWPGPTLRFNMKTTAMLENFLIHLKRNTSDCQLFCRPKSATSGAAVSDSQQVDENE